MKVEKLLVVMGASRWDPASATGREVVVVDPKLGTKMLQKIGGCCV